MAWVESHHGCVLTSLLELLQDQALTDLTLKLRDGEVRTSRLLVAALSGALYRMLVADTGAPSKSELTLELVSVEDWHCILSFYFSGNKLVTADNLEDILIIAHLYELEPLEEHCGHVLVDTLTPENCCLRFVFSKTHLPSASQEIFNFIKENFENVSQSPKFTCLSKDDVLELLRKPGVVTTEEMLCDAILRWMVDNKVDDDTSLDMIQLLRLREVSHEYASTTLMHHEQLVKNAKIQEYVAEMTRKIDDDQMSQQPVPKKRYPRGIGDDIIVFGHDDIGCRPFYCKKGSNAWVELQIQKIEDHFAAHMMDDVVIITGGKFQEKSTHIFHIPTMTWSRGPDLQEGRHGHSMTSVGDSVFAVAGCGSGRPMSSIERHEAGSDSWEKIGNLLEPVHFPGAAAICDVIIVAGAWEQADVIQTFNVTTRTAALQDTRLPSPMTRVRGVSLPSGAIFVEEEGDLVHLSMSDNGVAETRRVRLTNFGRRGFFGLAVKDGNVLCFGGGPGCKKSTAVARYSLQGELDDKDSLPELPVAMRVHGAFMAWIMDE